MIFRSSFIQPSQSSIDRKKLKSPNNEDLSRRAGDPLSYIFRHNIIERNYGLSVAQRSGLLNKIT